MEKPKKASENSKSVKFNDFWSKWKDNPYFKTTLTLVGVLFFGIPGIIIVGIASQFVDSNPSRIANDFFFQLGIAMFLIFIFFSLFEVYFFILETITLIAKKSKLKKSFAVGVSSDGKTIPHDKKSTDLKKSVDVKKTSSKKK